MLKTYKERLIAGLESRGWRRDNQDKSKYAAFTNIQVSGVVIWLTSANGKSSRRHKVSSNKQNT